MPPPKDLEGLRQAMGLFNYYSAYCPEFSSIAQPLYRLQAKDVRWQWGPVEQQAYDRLKQELADNAKVVRRPDFDKEFFLHSDFSQYGMGAIIGQKDEEGQ